MSLTVSKKYFIHLIPIVVFGLTVGLYRLHAQEPTIPPTEDNSTSTPPIVSDPDLSATSTDDGGGFLDGVIDFVEGVIEGNEEVPVVEEPIVEELPILPEPELPSIPAPITIPTPLIPFRGEVNIKNKDIDRTNGSYKCSVDPFSVNISHSSGQSIIKVENINQIGTNSRHLEIGELPIGLKVVFPGDQYVKNITGTESEFVVSVVKYEGAQKGSFTIPVFYSVGNITVMCQMNVVNNG